MPPRRRGTTTANIAFNIQADGSDAVALIAAVTEAAKANGATKFSRATTFSSPALEGHKLPVTLIHKLTRDDDVYADLKELAALTEAQLLALDGMDLAVYRKVRLAMAAEKPPLRPAGSPEIEAEDIVEQLILTAVRMRQRAFSPLPPETTLGDLAEAGRAYFDSLVAWGIPGETPLSQLEGSIESIFDEGNKPYHLGRLETELEKLGGVG
jgi:hypothetical protein